jgi:hypothetical protein
LKKELMELSALTEENNKATLTCSIVYASRSIRDAVLKTPMEEGKAATYDRPRNYSRREKFGSQEQQQND